MSPSLLQLLIEHLWQSTLFGLFCALVMFFLSEAATSIRYMVAWAGTIKFLIPFHLISLCFNALPGIPRPSVEITEINYLRHLRTPPGFDASLGFGAELAQTLLAIWAIGYAFLSMRWMWRRITIRNLKQRSCSHADATWRIMINRLWIPQNRATPRVSVVRDNSLQAGVFGLFKPIIIIPRLFADSFNSQESEYLLRHELVHVAKRDTLKLFLQQRIRDLFWFHPLPRWFDQQLSLLREIRCDEEVIAQTNQRAAYMSCLRKALLVQLPEKTEIAPALNGSSLKKRIRAISRPRPLTLRDTLRSGISLTAISVGSCLFALSVSNAITPEVVDPFSVAFGKNVTRHNSSEPAFLPLPLRIER